jgi:hypothetical protein
MKNYHPREGTMARKALDAITEAGQMTPTELATAIGTSSKNVLSILMQTAMIASVMMVVWVFYGYSFAFGGSESPFFGGFGKLFLSGVTVDSMTATFTEGVVIPEYLFITFQMTFAAITPALIIGAFAERVKFSAVIAFSVLLAPLISASKAFALSPRALTRFKSIARQISVDGSCSPCARRANRSGSERLTTVIVRPSLGRPCGPTRQEPEARM